MRLKVASILKKPRTPRGFFYTSNCLWVLTQLVSTVKFLQRRPATAIQSPKLNRRCDVTHLTLLPYRSLL
jgi:hypothetical protein